jgi:hypothetical protein
MFHLTGLAQRWSSISAAQIGTMGVASESQTTQTGGWRQLRNVQAANHLLAIDNSLHTASNGQALGPGAILWRRL